MLASVCDKYVAMSSYRRGDEIVCKITQNGADEEVKLQIIDFGNGNNPEQMLCWVPPWITIKTSFLLNKKHQKSYTFLDKFLDEYGTFIEPEQVIRHIPAIPGVNCAKCRTFIQHVEAPGGYICLHCRENPYR